MNNEKLPILISIPHGGDKIPEEIQGNILLDSFDILQDSDPFTDEIFDFKDLAEFEVKTDIARCFVDNNRGVKDLFPSNPDGAIKTHTSHNKKIYINPLNLETKKVY